MNIPLRLAMVAPNYPPCPFQCGVGDYTEKISQEFVRNGHSVTVFVSSHYTGPTVARGLDIVPLASRWGLRSLLRLYLQARRRKISLINLQFTPAQYGDLFKIGLCFVNVFLPVIISYHSLHRSSLWSKFVVMVLLTFCRGGISMNEEITAMLRKNRLIRKKLKEVPIGSSILPSVRIQAAKTVLFNLSPETLVLCYFGLLYPGKGLETLLEACGRLSQTGRDYRLVLIGAVREVDAAYLRLLQNVIREHALTRKVLFTGNLDAERVSQHIQAADIFVAPYDRGASIRRSSLIAGIVHGMPIITTIPEIESKYLDAESMLFIPPRDPRALVEAILKLDSQPALRGELSRGARRLAPRFKWDSIVAELLEEFQRLVRKDA